jgi:hypothetical protein
MTLDWTPFFPPGTHVLALPNWKNPRLYLPAQRLLRRWEDSSFYPASRFLARLYRLALRSKAVAGLTEVRFVRSSGWPLGEFTQDVLPQARSAVALVGTPGPAQKITVRVLGERGEVLGYLKYGEKEAARRRLEQERRVLEGLPSGAGPELLKFGPFGDGEALLTTALVGKRVPATLDLGEDLGDFLASLVVSPPVPLEAHPWVEELVRAQPGPDLDPWFEVLVGKSWPIVVQHGDFAPWNMLRRADDTLGAIDWEYGALESFPHLDLAYCALQVLALIQRQAPEKAAEYASRYLIQQPRLALNREEARTLIRLAAYDAYLKSREDGQPDNAELQAWRRTVWESNRQGF